MTYNKKSIGPVFTFILWLLLFFFICIVGISNVFGLETKTIYSNQSLDNSNKFNYGFVNEGGVDSITMGTVGSRISGKTKYINFYLSQNVALNYTYTIRINFLADDVQPYFSLNHVKEISVCNSSSCSNSSIVSIKKQNNNGFSTWVELTFNPTQVGNVIGVTLGDNSGTYITGETFFGISSVQIESKNPNQDVINNATNNTNNIINNNNSNTESIINNNNSNTESIINSNKETQQIIKDQFNTCRDSINLFHNDDFNEINHDLTFSNINNILTISGTSTETFYPSVLMYADGSHSILNWIASSSNINANKGYFNDSGDIIISVFQNGNRTGNQSIVIGYEDNSIDTLYLNSTDFSTKIYKTNKRINFISISNLPSQTYNVTFKIMISKNGGDYEPYGEKICTNKLDEQNKTSKGIFGKLKDLFNWLTNNDEADLSSAGDVAGWLPAGPIDSIINLPLTMLNNINSSLNKTCSPLEVNLPYVKKSVEIPCLNSIFNQITGLTNFWTWVGLISSVLILYRYLIELYKYYDRLTTLQANFISDWGGV